MFKHEYQGGPCVEVFSAQGKEAKQSQWKLTGSSIKKVFDKDVKSFIFMLEGSTLATKIQLPKETRHTLGLTQSFLVLQINVPLGLDMALDLNVLDSAGQKCRLAFSTAFKETQVTALHVKITLAPIKRNIWLNLCIDLRSIVSDNLKTSAYKSLESICVSGNCKLRRIFTMRNQALDTTNDDELYGIPDINAEVDLESIPKQCQLAADVHQTTQVINALKLQYFERRGRPDVHVPTQNSVPNETDLLSTTNASDGQAAYHIAFGSKVPGPSRRQQPKEGNTTSRSGLAYPNMDAFSESIVSSRPSRADVPNENRQGSLTLKQPVRDKNEKETDVLKNKESIKTSRAVNGVAAAKATCDAPKEVPVVGPHPPKKPSTEKPRRRRPRIKSSGNDSTNSYANSADNSSFSGSSESQKMEAASKRNSITNQRASNAHGKVHLNLADVVTDSDSDSTDSAEYNEIIKNMNKAGVSNGGDKENLTKGNRVYVFSSRPTCIDTGRANVKDPRKQGMASAPARKAPQLDAKVNNLRRPVSETTPRSSAATFESDYNRDFEPSVVSHVDSLDHSPQRKPLKDLRMDNAAGNGDIPRSTRSPTRQSVNRKSLREIPVEELQRSGGHKPYSFAKYQMGDITESFEQQMLQSMQRENAADAETVISDDEPSSARLPIGYDNMTDSSDDLSTLKSPKMMKHRSHNYQDEITNLGQNFMTQSNPRDWAELFSPPIVLPSSANSKQTVNIKNTASPASDFAGSKRLEEIRTNETRNEEANTDDELDLLYDPELHYFYDPRTTKYYELITPCSNSKANIIFSRQ